CSISSTASILCSPHEPPDAPKARPPATCGTTWWSRISRRAVGAGLKPAPTNRAPLTRATVDSIKRFRRSKLSGASGARTWFGVFVGAALAVKLFAFKERALGRVEIVQETRDLVLRHRRGPTDLAADLLADLLEHTRSVRRARTAQQLFEN